MSEMAEMDQMISKPRPGSIPLSVLIEFICQKMYTDLMRLVDLLPSKTDLEKKIEIATFFSRTRHLFIRLEALVKWSNNASKVDKCEKISNFLEEQSFFLINTANSLSRLLRETLVGARLPPFAVLHAIDIFTNKTYTRLPKSIKNCASSVDAVSIKEASQALLDLNRIIQNRLSLTQLPRQFKIIKINNGRVHFVVPHEFCVTMTLMSEAVDFPWRILSIKFLIRDPVANFQSLVHPAQVQFIHSQAQSRLLYRHFDKRPPLLHLYDMLHAFSISLQLDVLHEQAQRARATRPIDQLIVEAYKPGHSLVLSYWHALSRNHFQAQLGLDGKLQSTAYMLTIHVDPIDPQRPLCISHRPELPATESHRIGSVLQSNCLSIERLLTRTITTRAEQILQELRQELMVLSPGPVNLADAPLCLYVPLLWPCHPQEYLQFRVDPIQGTLGASCPFLLTSDAEQILLGSAVPAQTGPVASVEGYSRASVCAALLSLENALNQPSTRRVCPVSTNPGVATGDSSLLLAQTRSLRALSNTESRWRSVICQSLEHLRLCIGLVRLMKTAKTYRPFWQPAKRSLPLVLTPVQASLVKSGSSWPPTLVRFQQSLRFPIVFVQLFPNNEYYVVCEVIPAPLNVRFQYSLIVCAPVPDHIDVTIDAHGLAVSHTNQKLATASLQPTGSNLFLQVTHLVPLEVASVWFHNPSSSLSLLKSCIEKARSNALAKRTSRVAALLNRIKGCGGTQTDSSDFTSGGDVTLKSNHSIVPSLSRLIGTLEENILSNCLALELSRAGITHEGVQHDADGCLSAIRLLSLPSRPLAWQPANLVSLSDYVQQIVLRPHFDPSTHRRSWQLDLLFSGIGPAHSLNSVPTVQQKLRHQTAEWFVVRLEDYATLVKNVLAEWDCLCAMHALCYQVVTTPDFHLPPEVAVQSYNLKTLSLSYNSYYLANISFCHETGFTLALGFTPVNTPMTSSHESAVSAEVDSNPHMIIRHHLEELLNTTKSISMFAKTLVQTLPFVRAVEPLRDRTLSNHGLKTSVFYNNLRPVRGLVLIALSTYDLVLIYRACLSLRITLTTPRHTLFSAFSIGTSTSSQTVQLCDAYRQLAEPTNRTGEGWVHHSGENLLSALAPLPAFQTFLNALQEAYQMDIEAESWTGLTVAQLSQLVRSSRVPVKADTRHPTPCWPRPGSSPLESYLAGSLLFHASVAAIHSLDIPILTIPDYGGVEPVEPSRMTDVIQAGAFESHWSVSCLKCQLRLMPQRTGVEVATWKLTLRLSTLLPPNSGTMDRWPQETLNLIEEFFDVRVCAAPFQPSAVTAFFRLLTLPPRAFRSVVRLLPFDLHPPAHAQIQLRLGLVALGASKRVGAQMANRAGHAVGTSPHGSVDNTGPQTPDLVPGLPGILVRPPRITLQLLISRSQQSQQRSKFPGPPMAQLLSVGYDWDANRVAILTSSSSSGGSGSSSNTLGPSTVGRSDSTPSLPQLLLESDVESNANMMASTSGESALVHLAVLITQTAYSASSGTGSAPSLGTLPAKPMYSSS